MLHSSHFVANFQFLLGAALLIRLAEIRKEVAPVPLVLYTTRFPYYLYQDAEISKNDINIRAIMEFLQELEPEKKKRHQTEGETHDGILGSKEVDVALDEEELNDILEYIRSVKTQLVESDPENPEKAGKVASAKQKKKGKADPPKQKEKIIEYLKALWVSLSEYPVPNGELEERSYRVEMFFSKVGEESKVKIDVKGHGEPSTYGIGSPSDGHKHSS